MTSGPVMAIGDRQLIGRILTNLLINAIQSVPPSRKAEIDLKLYTNSDAVQMEIHDNGAGIPEAIRSKVFLPNFSTKRGGSGLGLAIAKRGIEHAGGTIWFETTEDVGTSFFCIASSGGRSGAHWSASRSITDGSLIYSAHNLPKFGNRLTDSYLRIRP